MFEPGKRRCCNIKHEEWGHNHTNLERIDRIHAKERNAFWALGNKKQYRKGQSICAACLKRLSGEPSSGSGSASAANNSSNTSSHGHGSNTQNDTILPAAPHDPAEIPVSTTETAEDLSEPIHVTDDDTVSKRLIEEIASLDQTQFAKVMKGIGHHLQLPINEDLETLGHLYRDLDGLTNIDLSNWILDRSPPVTALLQGIAGTNNDTRQEYCIAKAVETIYYLRKPSHVILPLSFSENVVSYSVTNSKIATNINGVAGGGGYESVRQWLNTQASVQQPEVKGDVVVAFDNDQVIGKSYHARTNNKAKMSIITAVCLADVNKEGKLQEREDLVPSIWDHITKLPEAIKNESSSFYRQVDQIHEAELMRSIDSRLKKLVGEGDWEQDHIDEKLRINQHHQEFGKVCPICGKEYARRKQKCKEPGCNNALLRLSKRPADDNTPVFVKRKKPKVVRHEFLSPGSTVTTNVQAQYSSPYDHIKSNHPKNPIKITARDPVFVNPNSYSSVIKVLQAIGKDLKIQKYDETNNRKWAVVICDGLPYSLCTKLLKDTYTCSECKAAIYKREEMTKHADEVHRKEISDQEDLQLEFDWVLLRIGYGHYEMNMVRSFMELNWDVFGKDLAEVLSFKSLNAQRYAKACSDNHKSWEMIRVFYLGTLDELLLPYVRHCKRYETNPTAPGYFEWKAGYAKSMNYQYMFDQVTVYAQSIMNMRGGLRRNNSDLVDSARVKHAPIFHGRNHPKYAEIEILEAARCTGQPHEIKQFIDGFQSFSDRGDSRGEDLDFKTEVINQQSKAWVSHGVPTEEVWLRIFRNLESLGKLRSSTFKRMGLADPKDAMLQGTSHEPRQKDVDAWRLHLRKKEYLNPAVTNTTKFESVSGEDLCDELLMMEEIGTERRRFKMQKLFGGIDGAAKDEPRPIFVTEPEREEYDSIENKTKDQIKEMVDTLIGLINSDSERFELQMEWKSVQKKNKPSLVNFYNNVNELISLQGQFVVDPQSDEPEDGMDD